MGWTHGTAHTLPASKKLQIKEAIQEVSPSATRFNWKPEVYSGDRSNDVFTFWTKDLEGNVLIPLFIAIDLKDIDSEEHYDQNPKDGLPKSRTMWMVEVGRSWRRR